MSKFDEVTKRFRDLPHMQEDQAIYMRELIVETGSTELIEIGTSHGKSAAYFAAILEDQGDGHLVTIDKQNAKIRSPNVFEVLDAVALRHRVSPKFAFRSYTWELQRLMCEDPRPAFDLCYFDGSHTWDSTGLGVVLIDALLKPGGYLILDDMDWTIDKSPGLRDRPELTKDYCPEERATPAVRLVWDLILPRLDFEHVCEERALNWGIARKPL